MIPLDVRDFVTRGCVTNIDLYHVQAPVAAAAAFGTCNASQTSVELIIVNMMKTPIVRKRFNTDTSFMINEKCEPQLYELLGEILPPVVVCRFQMIDGENSQQANLQMIFLISQVWAVFSFFENIKYGSPALIVILL